MGASVQRWLMRAVAAVLIGGFLGTACVWAQAAPLHRTRGAAAIHVWKSSRVMEFRRGSRVVRRFRVSLGLRPESEKRRQGDYRTPVGRYYVAEKLAHSRFHRFLGINYPNVDDAERGYREGLIDAGQWAEIFLANLRGRVPAWGTELGGRVGIHGQGSRQRPPIDWTQGCIAVSNEEIDFLFENTAVGTPVIIHE